MGYNAKNYTKQGGEETIINGKLTINGTLEYGEGAVVPPGPTFPVCANQAASEASTIAALKEDFNTLLAALKTAGLMEADTPAPEPDPDPDPETPDPEETPGGES